MKNLNVTNKPENFEYIPHGPGLSFTLKVSDLDDIHKKDLLRCKRPLSNLPKTRQWSELQLFTVLKNSISPLYWNYIDNSHDLHEIFRIIFSKVYDSSIRCIVD